MQTMTEPKMGRKKPTEKPVKPSPEVAKIDPDVMQHARIVVAFTGEGLGEYLSRLLRPLVIRDRNDVVSRQGTVPFDEPAPKKKP